MYQLINFLPLIPVRRRQQIEFAILDLYHSARKGEADLNAVEKMQITHMYETLQLLSMAEAERHGHTNTTAGF